MRGRELLYELLPAIYRIRDQAPHRIGDRQRRDELRALLGIIQEQFDRLEDDIAGLYDDWFIETCAEWVVPYIGDLLGVRRLNDIESSGLRSQRALVANTLRYRRRKGTLAVLEDVARDVSGWKTHAVEFFQLLGWTQNLNHLRYRIAPNPNPRNPEVLNAYSANRVGTVNLRSLDVVDRIGGPFDVVSHSVDVRPLGQINGWHNIRNTGIFTWRLQSYPVLAVKPRSSQGHTDRFHFSPLGNPAPLFTNPEPKDEEKGRVNETNVPGPIRPIAFYQNPEDYYGAEAHKSFAIYLGQTADPESLIPLDEIMCMDLSTWSEPPDGKRVAVDVERGRIAFASDNPPAEGITVTYHYGFSADIGGGPYVRQTTLEKRLTGDWVRTVALDRPDGVPPEEHETSLRDALDAWASAQPARAIIAIADNATYELEAMSLGLASAQHLYIQADDRNRPTLRLVDDEGAAFELRVTGAAANGGALTLDGLLIEGSIRVEDDALGRLEIRDCTLVPGRALAEDGRPLMPAEASLVVEPDSEELEIAIKRSIVGALHLPETLREFSVRDAIIDRPSDDAAPEVPRFVIAADGDGNAPGPACTLERVTVFGRILVTALELASEVIFTDSVEAGRRQTGCVRYSYMDDRSSATPPRFRCQPDLALATRRKELQVEMLSATEAKLIRARVRPRFNSLRYGRPDYAQLFVDIAEEIWTGSEDGAEMGAFEHLKQPQRVVNLRARVDEYGPYGLTTGIVLVT